MDSWTLQGDSYSFLRSAPRTFSLCHRDGTPNHVEIFDIINVPAQRSAISETTCLCDIFGDDCESPSLSSSPSAAAFSPCQRVVEGTIAASPPLDEQNDSSGSYHTAPGSSEGEEGSEDSRERFYSPVLQKEADSKQLEDKELSSEYPQVSEKSISDLEPKGAAPPQLKTSTPSPVTPSPQDLNSSKRTPSPGCYSPSPFNSEGSLSSFLSSSSEKILSLSSPNLKESSSEIEPIKEKQSSPSTQSLTPSPSLPQYLFEPRAINFNQNSDLELKTVFSSPLPSPSGSESKSHSEEKLVFPGLRNSSPDTHRSSPFSEPRGRVSLPDLFSRGSTPDIKDLAQSTKPISDFSTAERDAAATHESQDIKLSVEPDSTVSTPGPRYTPPSPVVSVQTTPELVGHAVLPQLKNTSTSPGKLSPASPTNTESRSPSPDPSPNRLNSLTFSELGTQASSPVVSLSPSPRVQHNSSPIEHRYTSPSPEIRITASSPEIKRKEEVSQVKIDSGSPLLDPHFASISPRSLTSSPHITGISYSVVQPEDRNSPPFPELQGQRTPNTSGVNKNNINSSVIESTGTQQNSTSSSVSLPESPLLPQYRNQTPSPQPYPLPPSPEPRFQTTTSEELQSPSTQHRRPDPLPEPTFSERRYLQSPKTLSTGDIPLYTNPTSVRNSPEIKTDPVTSNITKTQSPTHLEKRTVSPLFYLYTRDKDTVVELPNNSPGKAVLSHISVLSDTSLDILEQTPEREEIINEGCIQNTLNVASSIEEKRDFVQEEVIKSASTNLRAPEDRYQDTHSPFSEKEVIKSASPNFRATKDRNQDTHFPFSEKEVVKSASPNFRDPEDRTQDTHSHFFEKEVTKSASPNFRATEDRNQDIHFPLSEKEVIKSASPNFRAPKDRNQDTHSPTFEKKVVKSFRYPEDRTQDTHSHFFEKEVIKSASPNFRAPKDRNQDTHSPFFEKEVIKSASPNFRVPEDRNQDTHSPFSEKEVVKSASPNFRAPKDRNQDTHSPTFEKKVVKSFRYPEDRTQDTHSHFFEKEVKKSASPNFRAPKDRNQDTHSPFSEKEVIKSASPNFRATKDRNQDTHFPFSEKEVVKSASPNFRDPEDGTQDTHSHFFEKEVTKSASPNFRATEDRNQDIHFPLSEKEVIKSASPNFRAPKDRNQDTHSPTFEKKVVKSFRYPEDRTQDTHSHFFEKEVKKSASPNFRAPKDRNQDTHSPFFEKEVIKSASPNFRVPEDRNQDTHSPSFEKKVVKSASPDFRTPKDRNQVIHAPFSEKEIKSASPNQGDPGHKNPEISPVHRVTFSPPVQSLHPQFTSPALNFNNNVYSPKWAGTPESPRRQPLNKNNCEDKERLTQDMSHRINRRQTPSPPLTRFTPVHIIAPEKPYRQWQKRSPSQVLASKPSGNLKKEVTTRDRPNVDLVDTDSQAHWVKLGKQLEMDGEMPLEHGTDIGMDRGMNRETEREEQAPERGEGWQGVASYRGEQVELSFSARNRKGPVSRCAAPTSRETSQGLPTAHSYSESLPVTRQLQQQQSLPKLPSQQDTRGGSTSRNLQPTASQNRRSAPRRLVPNRLCQSSSSSMGSELDEADNEVKWLTDVAFRSLSSPEVDYLDMYNSSHCSSTNISQPSTQESPAGVNAAWLAYADFRGSAPKLDHDELFFQQPSTHYSDGLDSSRQNELGSFECIDVAVEREDCRRMRRGVPKRQIQLKRKDSTERKQDESSENSSPGVPVMVESPFQEGHPRGTFMRQHSTPAAMQECYPSDGSAELNQQKNRQSKFQKSASMDETYFKTKMASCLIKNVLSKKMQSCDGQPDEQANEEASLTLDSAVAPLKESPKPDSHDLSSSLQSDYSLSSEGFSVRGEASTKEQTKLPKSHRMRSNIRPSSSSSGRSVTFSQTDSEEAFSQSRPSKLSKSEAKSELKVAFESKKYQSRLEQTLGKESGDSANTTAWDTGASSASAASDTRARVTKRDQECANTKPYKQVLPGDRGTSKAQEITVKAVEKKKASLNVCLTPEAESKPFSPDVSNRQKEEKTDEKTEIEGHEDNKIKAPMHKVRDVRRLVKNIYNLSFKATTAENPSKVNEEELEICNEERREEVSAAEEKGVTQEIKMKEKREEKEKDICTKRSEEQKEAANAPKLPILPQNKESSLSGLQPMQIEYKAVCWKDDKNKTSSIKDDSGDKPQESIKSLGKEFEEFQSSVPDTPDQTTEDKEVHELCEHDNNFTAEQQKTVTEIHKEPESEENPVMTRTNQKPPMLGSLPKLPSKEREVSTAVVLIRENTNKPNMLASSDQTETPHLIQAPAPASLSPGSSTPGSTSGSGGHSVSMILKEKGYQADIGAVVADNHSSAGTKGVPCKHVNSLEIPLQTVTLSDGGLLESHRERTFSSSSTTSGPSVVTGNTDILTKHKEDEEVGVKPQETDSTNQKVNSLEQTPFLTKQKDIGDFEAIKRIDPTFPPRSPAIRKFRPQPVEVKSLFKDSPKQEMATNSTGNKPQSIEVKSIAKNSQKPAVPPKPNCKFRPADLGNLNDTQRTSATLSPGIPQVEERPQTIVVSSPTVYRKISNESTSSSNYSRKLTVSAVSSLKPPSHRPTATTVSSLTNQSTASSDTEASANKVQHQQPAASHQSPRNAPKPTSLTTAPAAGLGVTSAPESVSEPKPNQIPGGIPPEANQSAIIASDSQPQFLKATCHHEQPMSGTLNTNQLTDVSTVQKRRCTHQPCHTSVSTERSQRLNDLRFYASDDPPSYDERESFSPLLLPDLTPLRSNRYQPSSRLPPCSCTAGYPPHSGHTSPHHHHCSPHNFTPPGPPHSSYQVSQPPLHPLQYRPDPQPMSYQPGSPKSSPLGPNQPPSMYQPLHPSGPCPPHPSLMQVCPADRSMQLPQHTGPRRPPVHRSPHQQPPNIAGAPYSDPSHSHSPGLPPIDPQYLCSPQTMGSSYGSEYGGDNSSLYSESNYSQTPRRVLLDPETGKYFYIEVPVQPLRKMLFDPETGQYVEVLIPQQAMSHSGLYPPAAASFPPLHNSSMYAPAPQYMPCAAPPPLAHPQPPQYPEASAAATMHPGRPEVGYRNPSGQGSKPDPSNHPPLDHNYLENMYYVPTGMNASPNLTPPDSYHKHTPNMPTTGGKRS